MKFVGLTSIFFLLGCTHTSLATYNLVKINPLYKKPFLCAEHAIEGMGVGNAYGRDCLVVQFISNESGKWLRTNKNNGLKNDDWFSWKQEILAPFESEVVDVSINTQINTPGIPQRSKASHITFRRDDGIHIIYGHISDPIVKLGDIVKKGQVIARVGNNGNSWAPHIHVGAWHEKQPLQIIFDLEEWEKTIQTLYPQ